MRAISLGKSGFWSMVRSTALSLKARELSCRRQTIARESPAFANEKIVLVQQACDGCRPADGCIHRVSQRLIHQHIAFAEYLAQVWLTCSLNLLQHARQALYDKLGDFMTASPMAVIHTEESR